MSDLEQQIQAEQQRLYEVSSLTDEMEDSTAQVLLEWASAQIPQLAGDSSQLESRAKKLRRVVGAVNQFVGNGRRMSPEQMPEYLDLIYQSASSVGYPIQDKLMSPLAQELAGQSPDDMLIIIIAWIENDSLLTDVLNE